MRQELLNFISNYSLSQRKGQVDSARGGSHYGGVRSCTLALKKNRAAKKKENSGTGQNNEESLEKVSMIQKQIKTNLVKK